MSIDRIVEYYLPVLTTAGAYARAIQNRIEVSSTKDGANQWARALTDADITVQNFVEVATLAAWPDFGFRGEESDQSLIQKYFSTDAEFIVHLDPINGTYLYQTQQTGWDIVLSISQRDRLMAAISYMPVRERFYLAVRGYGARTGDSQRARLSELSPLHTRSGSRVCLTSQAPEVSERLRDAYDCFDIVTDHDPSRQLDNLNDLFTGRLDAFICRDGGLLDWGATAFIVAQAGGVATRLDGSELTDFENFDSTRSTDLLVASSVEIHSDIARRLT